MTTRWVSGVAAWLGWFFDGLELHLFTLVSLPIVAHLLGAAGNSGMEVAEKSAYIQAAFLVGWAIGGSLFGRLGDLYGRSRTLSLTILTYAVFTALCALASTWWQLMAFRFIAALGLGGEWGVGAALVTEAWPKESGPWIAAFLQTGVNCGVLLATVFVALFSMIPGNPSEQNVFWIGVLPAFAVFWIRRKVPDSETWQNARTLEAKPPGFRELFSGNIGRVTAHTTFVCAMGLAGWWLFLFWHPQFVRHLLEREGMASGAITRMVSATFFGLTLSNVFGNFFAGWLVKRIGYPRAIALLFLGLACAMITAFAINWSFRQLAWIWLPLTGFFGGVFGLFTTYLPLLFPPLLRTTGAGFCFNAGRLGAAAASLLFGWFAPVGDLRRALLIASILLIAAAAGAWKMPRER